MPNKIKLFLTFLAVTAIVSVFSFFDVVGGVRSALIGSSIKPLAIDLTHDADEDGLSDTDESYWNTDFQNPDTDGDGFMDGEEVSSRHNPTVAGPYDRLSDLNMTQKAANLAASGLVEGSLKPSSPDYINSLDSIALAVIDDGLKSFDVYPEDLIFTIIESSPEKNETYIKAVESIWEQFFKALGDEIQNIDKNLALTEDGGYSNTIFISYFIYKRDEFSSISKNWTAISVPTDWVEEHTDFLMLIKQMIQVNDAIAKAKDDPLKASLGMTLLIDLVERFPVLINAYSDKAKALNISSEISN